jgi:hypothetical protein
MEAPAPKPVEPGLLVHLRLDGSAAPAVAQGAVAWGPGRTGQAAKLDGSGAHLEIPSSPELDALNLDNYTIMAWYRPDEVPPGKDDDNRAGHGIINRTGWHEGLRYGNDKKFVFEHWLAGSKPEEPEWKGAGTWESEYEPGRWHHVAGVVDRKAGQTRLYVDGELAGSNDWDAGAKARDFGRSTWKIGMAAPGSEKWAWPAKGLVDDVRLYSRALTDAEVAGVFKAAK